MTRKLFQGVQWAVRNISFVMGYMVMVWLAGYLVALPILRHAGQYFRNRPAGEELFPDIRLMYLLRWVQDFASAGGWVLVASYFAGVGILLWLVHLWFSGGLLSLCYRNGLARYPFRDILKEGLSNFGRQLAAWPPWCLFAVIIGYSLYTLWSSLRNRLIERQQDEWIMSLYSFTFITAGLLILTLSLLWDLTRIEAIRPGINPVTAFPRVFFQFLRRLPYYALLMACYTLPVGIIWAAGVGVNNFFMDQYPAAALLFLPLVHAGVLGIRLLFRTAIWLRLADDCHQEDFFVARPEGFEPPTL